MNKGADRGIEPERVPEGDLAGQPGEQQEGSQGGNRGTLAAQKFTVTGWDEPCALVKVTVTEVMAVASPCTVKGCT